jgi:four helix bundle protein
MKHDFRNLEVWQLSFTTVELIYKLTFSLPDNEKFGLVTQIQRCAVSIPSNIAEGSGRTSDKEFIHFLNIALGSSYELETQLLLSKSIYKLQVDHILLDLNKVQRLIGGLKRKLNLTL